jgi:hypothetical protein
MFRPLGLHVPINRPGSVKEQPFEFSLQGKLVQEMESSIERSKNPRTQTSTPKYVEEVVAK